MWAVSSLAGAQEEQSAVAIAQSSPGGGGEAEGGADAVLTPAGLSRYTEDLSGLGEGSVLVWQDQKVKSEKHQPNTL